jgi:class 3 adenylate cyclase/pimeloyl-ACP methyl ester carboxylesterase
MAPETRYTRSGAVSIAYQVFGDGPFDLVLILPWGSHLELAWDVPVMRALFERCASFARVINFDKRGVGLSDRSVGFPPLETRMDDIRAVMDAAKSKRAAILGWSEGVRLSLLFAAMHPDRAWALVAYGGSAGPRLTPEEILRAYENDRAARERDPLGAGAAEAQAGSPNATEEEIEALIRMTRYAMSPGDEFTYGRLNMHTDLRPVLDALDVPTLVLQNEYDPWVPAERGRDLAARIPNATYVELPISGHIPSAADAPPFLDAVETFLSETWEGAAAEREPDRVLATVLFTDIVGSTEKMAALGDARWREVLEQHHSLVRRELALGRGREVDTAGDGFFAAFDGPARAVRCACAIADAVRDLGIEVRAGLHAGECELVDGKVAGIAVHTGARVASFAGPGEVLVSSTVKDLVAGSGLEFDDRGIHELKGIPGEWRLYAAV